jgi:phage FluMu protein Com
MSCSSCTRALQVATHRGYVEKCPACQIRKLAHMPVEQRVRQELRVELARIRKLRAPGPRQRAAAQRG